MSKALGIINFAGNHIQVDGLQKYRPVAAFSYLGRYRTIDFPISNMSNSGIDNIAQKTALPYRAPWNGPSLQYQF